MSPLSASGMTVTRFGMAFRRPEVITALICPKRRAGRLRMPCGYLPPAWRVVVGDQSRPRRPQMALTRPFSACRKPTAAMEYTLAGISRSMSLSNKKWTARNNRRLTRPRAWLAITRLLLFWKSPPSAPMLVCAGIFP